MSEKTEIVSAESIVAKLAEWSKKYPRGTIYPMSKISMDDELVEIENLAKEYHASLAMQSSAKDSDSKDESPALQEAVKEIAFPVDFDQNTLEIRDSE